jgi:FkbM family methyltransferase
MTNVVKRAGKALFRALGYCPVTVAGTRLRCDPCHVGFWRAVAKGQWEARTFDVLRSLVRPEHVYVDVGAWIGPTVVYAATRSRQVYCFEPDHVAYRYLLWNIELNQLCNVVPFHCALGRSSGIRRMASVGQPLGESVTRFVDLQPSDSEKRGRPIDVYCISWSDWLELSGVGRVDFIKIDVEGGEFELLPTMNDYLAEHRPVLYLSLHAPFLPDHKRRDSLCEILDLLSMYRKCFNKRQEAVGLPELAKGDLVNHCRSLLFMD